MMKINGIKAAWLEHDGLGELSVEGRNVKFRMAGGYTVNWSSSTEADANQTLRLFRAATKRPETRGAC